MHPPGPQISKALHLLILFKKTGKGNNHGKENMNDKYATIIML
jgi:hypothetical protein